jgi:hypothetical protein
MIEADCNADDEKAREGAVLDRFRGDVSVFAAKS